MTRGQKKAAVNPFAKLAEDKKQITVAIRNGKNLSTLKGIKFAKPL